METQEKVKQFIELRIDGKTFQEIAKKLDLSIEEIIDLGQSESLTDKINVGKQMKLESILQKHEANKLSKVERMAKLSNKIGQALDKKDLKELTAPELLKMLVISENHLKDNIPIVQVIDVTKGDWMNDEEERRFDFEADN